MNVMETLYIYISKNRAKKVMQSILYIHKIIPIHLYSKKEIKAGVQGKSSP